ncbi:DUF4168 domain-containing protein [Pseudohongiella sp. SYSU M77423]|uniref:DUF4168 domain-containing protein n=1 Tax=Pseudohongiella sp. SYSU M77423 TaxID=3042312 RepID=UPI000C58B571|nr:DUF4168 domain-containing protein [Pseudohongiella sp. SYSU M77423]MAY55478.1 hypothetical protein [Gammaproteobacteria bacterium]MBJ56100.1 hypothetical protein [Gammaproteobacteria bacterium]MDH7942715.1 DUF4168 domain-containing protein [Pseudohongiella sp. SYSU M77423]HBN13824.1 hypothetical protein [Pseudohongiella sp.]|tara:strand:- start:3699 stop:4073 length:375 start_codon:yes stop_codon:yes gene_type:complete
MLKKLIFLPLTCALAFLAAPVHAQPAPQAAPQGAPQMELTAELKDNFVAAYTDIMEIQMRYAQQLQSVTDEAEANTLQQAAQGEMQQAVEANDLSIQQYNQIIQMASADPALLQELETAIEANS